MNIDIRDIALKLKTELFGNRYDLGAIGMNSPQNTLHVYSYKKYTERMKELRKEGYEGFKIELHRSSIPKAY